MPAQNPKTKERNIFGIDESGQVFQFMMYPITVRNVEKIPYLRIPRWFKNKQRHEGWIPVEITSDGKAVEIGTDHSE